MFFPAAKISERSYLRKFFSLISIFVFVAVATPAMGQSTVLTGKVERSTGRSGANLKIPGYQVPKYDSYSAQSRLGSGQAEQAAQKQVVVVEKPVYKHVYLKDNRSFWQKHPRVKSATVGAGAGAGAGAVTALIAKRSVARGAAIGAGAGAGVGLVRSSSTMKKHPIVKDLSTGTLVGLGIGAASGRRGGTLKGAGVGAAVGLGASLLKNGLN